MPDHASLGSDESEREKRIFDQMHMKRHGALLSAAKDPDWTSSMAADREDWVVAAPDKSD